MSKFKMLELPRAESSQRHGESSLLGQPEQLKLQDLALEARGFVRDSQETIPPTVVESGRTGSREVLGTMIHARAARGKFLPHQLFGEPAWDMLLDLYLADILSKRVSVSSLCGASKVPATTALRWIGHLTDQGLLERKSDPCDGRRIFLSLSAAGLRRMDDYFGSLPN